MTKSNCNEVENPSAVAIVKKIASSKLFKFAAVGTTLSFAAAATMALYYSVIFFITTSGLFPYSEIPLFAKKAFAFGNMYLLDIYLLVNSYVTFSIAIIYFIAIWLIVKAGKREGDEMKTGGLMTVKVMQIISLVSTIVFGVLGISFLLYICISNGIEGIIVGLTLLIILIIADAFAIVDLILSINSISTAINTCRTGKASAKVSVFVAVMCFIRAIPMLFNPLFAILPRLYPYVTEVSLFEYIDLLVNTFSSFVSTAGSIMALVCFGITIFKYRSAMKRFIHE